MARRISCSLTTGAVRARVKTVTRRQIDTWASLQRGDRLTLIEKGMGLKKGEKQVVLAEVVVVSNTVESLFDITEDECAAEGFPDMTPSEFCDMWCESHGVTFITQAHAYAYPVRRIEWRYLDDIEGDR